MKMKTTLSLVAAAAVALFTSGAFAQDKTRAEVKEETKAANKAGDIATGESTKAAKPKSTKARTDVKGETKAANKSGEITTGESTKATKPKSTAARADVKTETKAAVKAGQTTEGEAPAKK
jgi:hypothetical protein